MPDLAKNISFDSPFIDNSTPTNDLPRDVVPPKEEKIPPQVIRMEAARFALQVPNVASAEEYLSVSQQIADFIAGSDE